MKSTPMKYLNYYIENGLGCMITDEDHYEPYRVTMTDAIKSDSEYKLIKLRNYKSLKDSKVLSSFIRNLVGTRKYKKPKLLLGKVTKLDDNKDQVSIKFNETGIQIKFNSDTGKFLNCESNKFDTLDIIDSLRKSGIDLYGLIDRGYAKDCSKELC